MEGRTDEASSWTAIEFSQSAVEGGATHAEETWAWGWVPAGLSEGGDESTTFVSRDGFRRKRCRLQSKLRRKIRRFERVPFAVNHRIGSSVSSRTLPGQWWPSIRAAMADGLAR